MGKILKVIILLISVATFSLAATTYGSEISRFDREYKKASVDEMLKFHHSLKNIYIQSIIKNDKNLKIQALKRLIITSSKLGLDVDVYEKELQTLSKITGKKIKIPPIDVPKTTKDIKPKQNLNAKELFNIKQQKQKKLQKKLSQGAKGSKARIVNTQSINDRVAIKFDRKINDIDIKTFALKGKKTYRYVYDIGSILNGGARSIDFKNAKRVRIGQYNKKTVRVVFTHDKPLKLYYSKIDDTLYIGLKQSISEKNQAQTKAVSTTTNKTKYTFSPSSIKIVIDAGHGGKDGGAKGSKKLLEKKVVLKVALQLGKELKKRGYKTYYTRTKDKFIQLRKRTKIANDKGADLFISIHANAAPNKKKRASMHGIETFFLSPARSKRSKNVAALENKSDLAEMNYFSKQTFLNFLNREKIISSNKLALDVQQSMLNTLKKHYKVIDGGVREAPFWVLVGAQMPAILVEIGYITHPVEGKRIGTNTYQIRIVKGIADGIDNYFAKNF